MRQILLLVGALFGITLFAADRPVYPERGEDKVLTGGKTAREFFAERTKDSPCRRDLLGLWEKYKTALKKLDDMKKAGDADMDEQYDLVTNLRRSITLKNNECGECAAHPTKKIVIQTPARTEVWYQSDGSCQLPFTDKAQLAKAFDTIRDSVLRAKQHPHYADGLHHVLEVKAVDGKTGKFLPEVDLLGAEPQPVFVSVRGPEILGLLTAFSYVKNATWKDATVDGVRELVFKADGQRPPLGFQYPDVHSVKPSGAKETVPPLRQKKVTQLLSYWYVSEDGYLRYFTAAEFGVALKFIEELGQEVMLDSVFSQYKKAVLP